LWNKTSIDGLATATAALPHVVAALRGGLPFVPSIYGDHNRGQWRDSSSKRKQLLCTRCYLDEAGGMSSSLEAKKKPVQKKTAAAALLLLVRTVVISLSFQQCLLAPKFSQKDIQVQKRFPNRVY
jgi:hypothetical protein